MTRDSHCQLSLAVFLLCLLNQQGGTSACLVLELVDIPLLDHFVIRTPTVSFAQRGRL